MKKVFLIGALSMLAFQFAEAKTETILKCLPAVLMHDVGISASLIEDQQNGELILKVRRRLLGKVLYETYPVEYRASSEEGGAMLYTSSSSETSLSYQGVASPNEKGQRPGTLKRKNKITELLCK